VSNTHVLHLSTCSGQKIRKAQGSVTLLLLHCVRARAHTHMLYFTVLLPGQITHSTRSTQWSATTGAPCLHLTTTSHMLSFNVFCYGPGTQAKCTMHSQMPSQASHLSTIPPGSCTLYLTFPSISKQATTSNFHDESTAEMHQCLISTFRNQQAVYPTEECFI